MTNGKKPIANPVVVLREEFDDWAVLFDPDTGRGFGLNPIGVYLWKLLDGEHIIDDLFAALCGDMQDLPQEAGEHLVSFIEELTREGLAGYEAEQAQDCRGRRRPCRACVPEGVPDAMQCVYEPPRLVNLSGDVRADGTCYYCSGTGSQAASGCTDGAFAIWGCTYGNNAQFSQSGTTDCQAGVYATCDCISYGAYAGGQCSNGTGTYH